MKCAFILFSTFLLSIPVLKAQSHLEVIGHSLFRGDLYIHSENDSSSIYIGFKAGSSFGSDSCYNTFLGVGVGNNNMGKFNTFLGGDAGKRTGQS